MTDAADDITLLEAASDFLRAKVDKIEWANRGIVIDSSFNEYYDTLYRIWTNRKQLQGKDIRQHLENISPSAMSRIFKRLCLHGIIERIQGTYKYFVTAYGKEIIAAGLRNCRKITAATSLGKSLEIT